MRFITLFRKPEAPIDWDFHVSEDDREVEQVLINLEKRRVTDISTYELGPKRAVAFCHEEGKLQSLPLNRVATAFWFREIGEAMAQKLNDVLVGNIVIIQCDTEEEFRAL